MTGDEMANELWTQVKRQVRGPTNLYRLNLLFLVDYALRRCEVGNL